MEAHPHPYLGASGHVLGERPLGCHGACDGVSARGNEKNTSPLRVDLGAARRREVLAQELRWSRTTSP